MSVCSSLFPPCTVLYRFNTVLIGIWLSLLHPVVSPDYANPEGRDILQVQTLVMIESVEGMTRDNLYRIQAELQIARS